ncbi:rCG31009 [Rattus norvegicus]|uniref:RCG31009 n=1 Tax=Rattus norvegicus TaxID=10116 RepID=A6ISM6_RAT|nr:rCG31009 [Rattus norvegicus]
MAGGTSRCQGRLDPRHEMRTIDQARLVHHEPSPLHCYSQGVHGVGIPCILRALEFKVVAAVAG